MCGRRQVLAETCSSKRHMFAQKRVFGTSRSEQTALGLLSLLVCLDWDFRGCWLWSGYISGSKGYGSLEELPTTLGGGCVFHSRRSHN